MSLYNIRTRKQDCTKREDFYFNIPQIKRTKFIYTKYCSYSRYFLSLCWPSTFSLSVYKISQQVAQLTLRECVKRRLFQANILQQRGLSSINQLNCELLHTTGDQYPTTLPPQ